MNNCNKVEIDPSVNVETITLHDVENLNDFPTFMNVNEDQENEFETELEHDVHEVENFHSFTCDFIDEKQVQELFCVKSNYDPLECYLVNSNVQEEDCIEVNEMAHYFDS